jgi:hypothetical protein
MNRKVGGITITRLYRKKKANEGVDADGDKLVA